MTDGDDSSDDEYKPIARAKSKKKPKSPHSHKKKKGVYGATGSSVDRRGTINRSVDAYTGSPWRWHVLFVMAMLNMLNNVVCFTFSPIAHFAHSQYGNTSLAAYTQPHCVLLVQATSTWRFLFLSFSSPTYFSHTMVLSLWRTTD
jgi:hypothetical protein